MNKIKSLVAMTALTVAAFSTSVRADGISLEAVGILNFSSATLSSDSVSNIGSVSSSTTVGFGLLGALGVMPGFDLQLGALWVPRKFSVNDPSGNNLLTASSPWLEIPLLLRFTALPFITVGAGPYYAKGLGSITLSKPNLADVSQSYDATNASSSDFGVEGSVSASFPILPFISVVGDLRYLLGLSNLSSLPGTSEHYRDWEFMAGVSLGL